VALSEAGDGADDRRACWLAPVTRPEQGAERMEKRARLCND
jgi:hypothetical protein